MFKTIPETRAFFDALIPGDSGSSSIVRSWWRLRFTALAAAVEETDGTRVTISAQNIHWKNDGAFTGEVSVRMLVDAGCTTTIIGHSERRQLFGRNGRNGGPQSSRRGSPAGLKAIVCVGEILSERDGGQAVEVVRRQVQNGIGQLTLAALSNIIVAYEPVWAIGTGQTTTPEVAAEMHAEIRKILAGIYGAEAADAMRILYGGSVKAR